LSLHDNQSRVTKISLALSSGRDNDPSAATAEMTILIVAVFPCRLSRYTLLAFQCDTVGKLAAAEQLRDVLGKALLAAQPTAGPAN
jgi:hypothetical protein